MKISYDEFYDMYWNKNLPMSVIANKLGCSRTAVLNIRKRLGIKQRQRVRCKDMLGSKHGRWTVIGKCQYRHRVLWKCRCECGNEAKVSRTSLVRHKSTKCRKCGYVSTKFLEPMPRFYWTKVLIGAKYRRLKVSVTQDYCRKLYHKQKGKCAITGVDLYLARSIKEFKAGLNTASLDRIDSSKGYTPKNIQWVHKVINIMKFDLDQNDFKEWCKKVVNHG